jgi:hypothetical protein
VGWSDRGRATRIAAASRLRVDGRFSSRLNGDEIAMGAVLVAIGAVLLALGVMLKSALKGVFGVALCRYAADGEASGPFSSDELDSAVRSRARAWARPASAVGAF